MSMMEYLQDNFFKKVEKVLCSDECVIIACGDSVFEVYLGENSPWRLTVRREGSVELAVHTYDSRWQRVYAGSDVHNGMHGVFWFKIQVTWEQHQEAALTNALDLLNFGEKSETYRIRNNESDF